MFIQTKPNRWHWGLAVVLALALFASAALAGEKQAQEGKVAVVNGSVITQADFDGEMWRVQQRLLKMGKSPGDSQLSEIKKQVLENLIDRELLYQETQKQGIVVDEVAINGQVKKLKDRFSSEAAFKSALTKAHLSETTLRLQFKRGIALQQFVDKHFVQKITVSGEESKAFYDNHPDLFKQPEQVRARHILIKVDPGADESSKVEARAKLEKIQKRLRKGEDFGALAKEVSEDPSSVKGGDLGYFKRGQMVKAFEEAAFSLKPGEVSDIVETEFGYHLIDVIDKKSGMAIPYEDIKDRLEDHIKQEKVQEEVNSYIEKLKEKAKVERFLAEDSS
jgi:peptidyl-prolyl cis-trans isomerase C